MLGLEESRGDPCILVVCLGEHVFIERRQIVVGVEILREGADSQDFAWDCFIHFTWNLSPFVVVEFLRIRINERKVLIYLDLFLFCWRVK